MLLDDIYSYIIDIWIFIPFQFDFSFLKSYTLCEAYSEFQIPAFYFYLEPSYTNERHSRISLILKRL